MTAQKMSQPNVGIKCMVNTCHYYGTGDHCHAEKIEVAKGNETDCATFLSE